jgi:hypothetical protein
MNEKSYEYIVDGEKFVVKENDYAKIVRSENYNYNFDKETGFFQRWGKTTEDDPQVCPVGCEIADIEVTTSCSGVGGKLCKFCYKSNTPNGKNMSLETFKKLFDKFPKVLNQIAFGADSRATSNPELFDIMKYAKINGVIPNITVAEVSDEIADKLASHCGAVAVSRYEDKNYCYDAVEKLTSRGMKQVNIHVMTSVETFDMVMETLKDRLTDKRLEKLNAIVLLSLKKKGRGKTFNCLPNDKFKEIIDFALENNISVGFDSCSCKKFLSSVKENKKYKEFEQCAEPCEAHCFSFYVNVDGNTVPCSFCDGEKDWEEGIDVVNCVDFIKDIWYNDRVVEFRKKLLAKDRSCPVFEV